MTAPGSWLKIEDMVAVSPETDDQLLDELGRHLRAADALISGLAEDMAAAGAPTAAERAGRARAELREAQEIADRMRGR